MGWISRLFGKRQEPEAHVTTLGAARSGDMREVPVDNPMDVRPDGSIRPGDPAWAMFEEMMKDGKPRIGNQREDGTWDVQSVD